MRITLYYDVKGSFVFIVPKLDTKTKIYLGLLRSHTTTNKTNDNIGISTLHIINTRLTPPKI